MHRPSPQPGHGKRQEQTDPLTHGTPTDTDHPPPHTRHTHTAHTLTHRPKHESPLGTIQSCRGGGPAPDMAEQPRRPWRPGQSVKVRYDIVLNDRHEVCADERGARCRTTLSTGRTTRQGGTEG